MMPKDGGMRSAGLRIATLSINTIIDAIENARKPLKPLLGIGIVIARFFYNLSWFVLS
jgi:hypothetical protein